MVKETTTVAGVFARTVPPIAVSAVTFCGLALQQWVYVVTIVYTIIQIVRVLPKMYGCGLCFYRNRTCNRSCKEP